MKQLFYLLLLSPVLVLAQSTDQNYIKKIFYKQPVTNVIATPTSAQAAVDVTYFDGLGRPIQHVAHKKSATGKDVVTPIDYDYFGRQALDYLPYVSQTATMAYDAVALDNVWTFYNTVDYDYTTNPYSEKKLEASPLGRVLEQASPGADWSYSSGHTVRFVYSSNIGGTAPANMQVLKYKAIAELNTTTLSIGPGSNFYAANSLYKNIIKNENWEPTDNLNNTSEEYKDIEGRLIMKRTYSNGINHDTHYVYDQYGNLSFVIPPLFSNPISLEKINNLCYQYKYDHRNRLVEKKLPGKQWEFIVYDKLDRVVAIGPANSPFTNIVGVGWLITKYDAFNRSILTAWKQASVTSSTRNTLQGIYNGATATTISENRTTGAISVSGIGFRYTNVAQPTSGYHILTLNYYDTYDFTTLTEWVPATLPTSSLGNQVYYNHTKPPKGLATGTWVRILERSNDYRCERSYMLYDNKTRMVMSHKVNHLGGYTKTLTQYDFEGKVLQTQTAHKREAISQEIVVNDYLTYTDQGRLVEHRHKINNIPEELISKNEYDELGQLKVKRVGGSTAGTGLQKVDYSYNIRGWLKGINNTGGLAEGGSIPVDLFAFKLNYNTVEAPNAVGTALYNGNISETYWKTYPENVLRKYSYEYDALNRLTEAVYVKPGLANPVTNSYNEEIGYDPNGNITNLNRNGYIDGESGDVYTIDHLSYAYDSGTNILRRVDDLSNSLDGFKDGDNPDEDYSYDANGNMTTDWNKEIKSISYNHLNLPTRIEFKVTEGEKFIQYIYNAVGVKVGKLVLNQGPGVNEYSFTDYMDGFQYVNDVLQFFPTAEGYVSVTNGDRFNYVYNYTDHLGNIRLSYTDDGGVLKILEENHYYPFGMKHSYNREIREWGGNPETGIFAILREVERNKYQYKYNGKEYQDELGLNIYDYENRTYDQAIGRWWQMDPLAEQGRRWSPYAYAMDNPVYFIDPDGMWPWPSWSSIKAVGNAVVSKVGTAYNNSKLSRDVSRAYVNTGVKKAFDWTKSKISTAKPDTPDKVKTKGGTSITVEGGKAGPMAIPEGDRNVQTADMTMLVTAAVDVFSPETTMPGAVPDGSNPLTTSTGGEAAAESTMGTANAGDDVMVTTKTDKYATAGPVGGGSAAEAQVVKTSSEDTTVKSTDVQKVINQNLKRYQKEKAKADSMN